MTSLDLLAPPWEWQTDSARRPVAMDRPGLDRWAPVRAPYGDQPRARSGRRVIVVARAPAQMPCEAARGAHHGFGRPPITKQRPGLAQQAAWLVDLAGWKPADVARTYGASRRDPRGRIAALDEQLRTGPQWTLTASARADDKRRLEKQLRAEIRRDLAASTRDLAAMRRLHWERGVLPWALWPNGKLPAEWWLTERWAKGLLRMMTQPTLETVSGGFRRLGAHAGRRGDLSLSAAGHLVLVQHAAGKQMA